MDLARKQRVTCLVCLAASAAFALQSLGDMVRAHPLWIESAWFFISAVMLESMGRKIPSYWLCAIGTASFAFSIYLAIVHKGLY